MTDPSEFEISFDAGSNHYTYKRLGTRDGRRIGAPITADDLFPQLSAQVPVGVSDHLVNVAPLESSLSDPLSSSGSSMIVTDQLALLPSGGHLQEQAAPEAATAAAAASNIEEEVDQGIAYVYFILNFLL